VSFIEGFSDKVNVLLLPDWILGGGKDRKPLWLPRIKGNILAFVLFLLLRGFSRGYVGADNFDVFASSGKGRIGSWNLRE
jgi:hypothetical protein